MRQIDSSLAKEQWKQVTTTSPFFFAPSHLDITCGACVRSQVGVPLEWKPIGSRTLYAAFTCHGCDAVNRLLLLEAPQERPQREADLEEVELYQHPSGVTTKFSEEVGKLSPKCVQIYSQAERAEQLGLSEIVGCGYRRALEFLVKDFLINYEYQGDANQQEEVRTKLSLGDAIKKLGDPGLVKNAKGAAWLGNDKTHYKEKHNATIEDLKGFINLVVGYIELQLLREKMKK